MEIDYSWKFKLIDKLKKSTEWNNSIIIGMTKKKITETTHQSSKKYHLFLWNHQIGQLSPRKSKQRRRFARVKSQQFSDAKRKRKAKINRKIKTNIKSINYEWQKSFINREK